MEIVDFTEVATAKGGSSEQEAWEFFARDFLHDVGLDVQEGPDRGPDGGRDLIAVEMRKGVVGSVKHTWLVSCKHHAHSGKAVSDREEIDPLGRVRKFGANGFMAFYSTVPSSSLSTTLTKLKREFELKIYDRASIERELTSNDSVESTFKRYLPSSYEKWISIGKKPSLFLGSYLPLNCAYCGKDLLAKGEGNIVFARKLGIVEKSEIEGIYWACKGSCDRAKESEWRARGCATSWRDISDAIIPLIFAKYLLASLSRIRSGFDVYSEPAFDSLLEFTQAVAQRVLRQTSPEEMQRVEGLKIIPSYLGGLG